MYRNILVGIILALTIILLMVIFLLSNQWYYESQGDERFRAGKYEDSANLYLKALEGAQLVGQARLMYKVGLAYQNARDYERARDYYFQAVGQYPDSPVIKLVALQIEKMFGSEGDNLEKIAGPELSGTSPILSARAKYVRAYQNLTKLLHVNRSGVPADLEAAYQAYKTYHENYKRQIARALEQHKAEHPEMVWPPPGWGEGPNPTSVEYDAPGLKQAGTAATGVPAPTAARPPSDEHRLNIPVPGKPESKPTDIDRDVSRGRPTATFAP